MAKAEMRAGGVVETLTQNELADVLTRQTTAWFQEQARGFTTARFAGLATVATGAVTVPANDSNRFGPDSGFAWAVQRVSASGLSTNDTLSVYRDAATALNFLGYITATASLHPGSKGIVLRGAESLVVAGSSLGATGDIVITGEAIQVSELDLYKIL